jgi:hypothetical protein
MIQLTGEEPAASGLGVYAAFRARELKMSEVFACEDLGEPETYGSLYHCFDCLGVDYDPADIGKVRKDEYGWDFVVVPAPWILKMFRAGAILEFEGLLASRYVVSMGVYQEGIEICIRTSHGPTFLDYPTYCGHCYLTEEALNTHYNLKPIK